MNAPLAEMLRYNKWATMTLVEACRSLTDEQLDTQGAGVAGTVRVLLLHFVGAQQTMALRPKGRQHEGELKSDSPWPGFNILLDLAAQSADELIAIAEAMDTPTETDLPYMGTTYRFPTSFFLAHAMEHGVEHRTEIKVALNQLGIETPNLDGWAYSEAMGYGQAVPSPS
jgi:uncharacterized damage-inducible protein DinB